MESPSSAPGVDWRGAVVVREENDLADLLRERLPSVTEPRAVSVTDLVAPRRAYWRAIAPVRFDEARQARVDLGRALHGRLGAALASEGSLEVRIRRDGVVGRIDVLSEVPVEVKTSSSAVAADDLPDARPDQVEQLVMYCTLAGHSVGRLVTLVVGDASDGSVQVVDFAVSDPEAIRLEMRHRGEALRRAWKERQPRGLPACRWFGRGCEFQEAAVCDCSGSEPVADPVILDSVARVTARGDIASRIEARLRATPSTREPPTLLRFRDLLYPRRTYFERTVVEPGAEPPRARPWEPPDLYARLTAAVEGGPLGEVARLPPRLLEPAEEVTGFRGAPYLVRTSRARDRASDRTLLDGQPQYALELGFRAVATGTSVAHLILGRERAADERDRVQAFEYRFSPASAFSRLWRERDRQLEVALARRDPASLPACPEWMYPDCPYRFDCGCGATGTRSQR